MLLYIYIVELVNKEAPPILLDPRSILIKVVVVVLFMLPVSMLRKISRLEKVHTHTHTPAHTMIGSCIN